MSGDNPCGPYDGMPWPTPRPPAGWDVEFIDHERGWRSRAWLWVPEEVDWSMLWTHESAPITYYRALPDAGREAQRMARELERDRDMALDRGLDVAGLRRWKDWLAERRLAFGLAAGSRNSIAAITGVTS